MLEIKVNSIITLSNDDQYMVLNEANYKNERYFLVMGIDNNKEIISSKVAIFKEEKENENIFVEKVTDSKLIIDLTKILKDQL